MYRFAQTISLCSLFGCLISDKYISYNSSVHDYYLEIDLLPIAFLLLISPCLHESKFFFVNFCHFSPDGSKIRSKPQLARFLGDKLDIGTFDFRSGKVLQSALRKSKRQKGTTFDYARGWSSITVWS